MSKLSPFCGAAWNPRLCAILAVACAFALRWWFVHAGPVPDPIVGDAIQYSNYAWNLEHFHTFSMTPPGSDKVLPDSYRDPGYPLLLAALLHFFGSGSAWYHAVLFVQIILGALSSGLTVLVCARWLDSRLALAAGLAVAVWPHCVAISDYLMSETLSGFMVLLALWLLVRASKSGGAGHWAMAGLGFGAAALVNATLTPFGILLALVLWLRPMVSRRAALALLFGAAILPGLWTIRNMTLEADPSSSAGGRAIANLVQGSWPEYHSAFVGSVSRGDAWAKETMAAIDQDNDLAANSLTAWLGVLLSRVEQHPLRYAAWYAYKPALLWAWSIRVGIGDVYPHQTLHPIYTSSVIMRVFESLCVGINPVLFALMAAAVLVILLRPASSNASLGLYAVALLAAYETLIYTVLQAEPRYSIPFRPEQMMLVASAAAWLWGAWLRYRSRRGD